MRPDLQTVASLSERTMARVLGVCTVLLILTASLLAWLWTKTLDHYTLPPTYNGPAHPLGDVAPFPADRADNLWWFLQISDIHISRFRDPKRTTEFKHFCSENIDVIKPSIVLVTGDLTDAKTWDNMGSRQFEVEWKSYQQAVAHSHAADKTVWIDVRGNHDAFGIPTEDHHLNYYRKYSVLGEEGDSTFRYQHKLPFGTYSFVSVYAILNPGPRRPFNFFGILKECHLQKLEDFARETSSSNHTVFFGHYPTGTISAPHDRLSSVMRNGIAYLCGHLHSIGGRVPHMNAVQKNGLLELELEDWKENRMYRVMAFDHDLLSFVDVKFGTWPVVLITNPKRARFMSPRHEPINKMRHSTHIRFLVFSPATVVSAVVEVDDVVLGEARQVEGPLFVIPWDAAQFAEGMHTVRVTAVDAKGHTHSEGYRFALDGSRPEQWLAPSMILMTNVPLLFFTLYVCEVAVFVLTLVALRFVSRSNSVYFRVGILRGFVELASRRRYLYSLIIIAVYPLIGPWFVGNVTCDDIGVYTLYGFFVQGVFVGETFSCVSSVINMVLFQAPITLYFALQLNRIYVTSHGATTPNSHPNSSTQNGRKAAKNGSTKWPREQRHIRTLGVLRAVAAFLCLVLALGWILYECVNLYMCYGVMALIVSPKSSWTLTVVLWLLYRLHCVDLVSDKS